MSARFNTYEDARDHAQREADRLGLDMGIERVREYGKWGFNVRMLPRERDSYGCDHRAERVRPLRRA